MSEEKSVEVTLSERPSDTETHIKVQTVTKPKIFVIGICGGDCSGKRLIQSVIKEYFEARKITIASVPQESFLIKGADINKYEPKSYNWEQMIKNVSSLKEGNAIELYPFNKIKQDLEETPIRVQPSQIIVVHGLHILSNPQLKKLLSLSCYVDSDDDIRLSRRVYQDTKSRGKTITECVQNYLHYIKPAYERYTEPLKKFADLLVPQFGGEYIANEANIEKAGFQQKKNKAVDFLLSAISDTIGIKTKNETGVGSPVAISRSTSIGAADK